MRTSPAKLWKHCVTAVTTCCGSALRHLAVMIQPCLAALKQTAEFSFLIKISVNLPFGHANLHPPVLFCFVSVLPRPGT